MLTPGGRLAILEFAIPTTPGVRALYLWYFNHVLPRIGRLVSRHNAAYGYLPASVGAFASPDEFVKILRQSGFRRDAGRPADLRHRLSVYGARLGARGSGLSGMRARCLHCSPPVPSPEPRLIYCSKFLMYFDFEDYRPDIAPVGSAISWREGSCCRSSSTW